MAVECSITSLRMARMASPPPASASLILYSGVMSTIVDAMTAFGERLRAERHAHGWPIERLAAPPGGSPGVISKIERGESSPTAVVLGKLSAALELSVSELLAPGTTGAGNLTGGQAGADGGTGLAGDPAAGGGGGRRGGAPP